MYCKNLKLRKAFADDNHFRTILCLCPPEDLGNRATPDTHGLKQLTKGPGKRGHIVADTLLPMSSWAAQTGKHLSRTQNVSEQNQKHFLCPGHKICVRNKCCARGQTGKHLGRQQCVRNNVSSFARALMFLYYLVR